MIFSDVFVKGGGGFSAAVEHVRRAWKNSSVPGSPQQPAHSKHYGSNWWKSKKYKCLTLYDQPIPEGIEAQWDEVQINLYYDKISNRNPNPNPNDVACCSLICSLCSLSALYTVNFLRSIYRFMFFAARFHLVPSNALRCPLLHASARFLPSDVI
jgi:hypothetical protein